MQSEQSWRQDPLSTDAGDRTPFDSFQIFTSLTKIQGHHSLKTGFDLRELREASTSFASA